MGNCQICYEYYTDATSWHAYQQQISLYSQHSLISVLVILSLKGLYIKSYTKELILNKQANK